MTISRRGTSLGASGRHSGELLGAQEAPLQTLSSCTPHMQLHAPMSPACRPLGPQSRL